MQTQYSENEVIPLSPDIFGAYDIRGIVGETLNQDIIYQLGRAIASEASVRNETTIFIARDGRLSGPSLLKALAQGLQDSGVNVVDLGAVPTPLLYFATHTLGSGSGVMLTGSHNPANYNGLKIVLAGETLATDAINDLQRRVIEQDFLSGNGEYREHDCLSLYCDDVNQRITLSRPLKVVVDAGNGIAGKVVPSLLRHLGCEVIEYYCEVDGNFPNHHPDPSDMANLQDLIAAVDQHQAAIGLAFDGDGDRLGVVTNQGEIIHPDRLLMLLAKEVLAHHPDTTIVFDVKCSQHLAAVIAEQGGTPLMWKTGHSLIKAKMRETKALLAGEMSGHVFYNDNWYGFDDAIYACVRLLAILADEPQTASELFAELPDSINTPEIKIPVSHKEKFEIVKALTEQGEFNAEHIITVDGVRVEYADGWGLVRASNTTPCLVLRFEADNESALARIQTIFYKNLQRLIPELRMW